MNINQTLTKENIKYNDIEKLSKLQWELFGQLLHWK